MRDDHVPTIELTDQRTYIVTCSCGAQTGFPRLTPVDDEWTRGHLDHQARSFREERDRARAKMMEFAQMAGAVSFDA